MPILDLGPGPIPPRRAVESKSAQVGSVSLDQAIEQCVEADMARIGTLGAAVTVIADGAVIFDRGFGIRGRGHAEPVTRDTRFRIGSETKMLTAAAVMQQVEAGLVDLDAPVTTWIPELSLSGRWPADSITVRHLITHTAAVPDYYEYIKSPAGDGALAAWAADLDEVQLHAPPGTFWNYTNPGFSLAGLVAERASGLPYRELVETRVFEAAGMSASTFDPDEVVDSGDYSYGHNGNQVIAPDGNDSWIIAPAGAAFSTASDMAAWALLLIDGGGAVLAPESAAAMQERQVYLDYIPDYHYGFGIFAERYKGLDVRQHGGNIWGWGAFLLWIPEERFVVAILGNSYQSLSAAAYCIVDAVLEPDPTLPPDYSTDPATWSRYAGRYRIMDASGELFWGRVENRENGLYLYVIDPRVPVSSFNTRLQQLFLDTFAVTNYAGTQLELRVSGLTFIQRRDQDPMRMWLRNRVFVGERVLPPRQVGGRRQPG